MALVNDVKKEINAKIVYIGPTGAGKSTALRNIYGRLKPESRSDLKSMAVGGHQMLFFDFSYPMPLMKEGYSVRFHLYTIQAAGDAPLPWKMLLKGVDGVVVLADSSPGMTYANLESCTVLVDALAHYGVNCSDIPVSLQCNKADIRDALSPDAIKRELFPETESSPLPVVALTGEGILEGLNSIVNHVLRNLGLTGEVQLVAKAPVVPSEDVGENPEDSFLHCSEESPAFEVEIAGTPVKLDNSTIEIPLRLKGAACGKSAEFKVKVSIGI
jgi:signal recognition particle receptor subunit beta